MADAKVIFTPTDIAGQLEAIADICDDTEERTMKDAAAYIRRANAVLGPECACGHFEVAHRKANHKGQSACCGCERFIPAGGRDGAVSAPVQCGTFRDLAELPKRALPANLVAIGEEIRWARGEHDVSMGVLARFLGCHVAKLSDLERGQEQDPGFAWCDACGGNEKRHECKRCGGLGYEPKRGGS